MDIIKWIKKNNFKDIDDDLSYQIDKLIVLQSDKEKLINKIKSYKTNLKSLKESLDIVNGEISKANKKALKSLKVLPIISIGFDARSSTYICIVKYKNVTKSFYLGNESKLKSQLQQFYLDDLHTNESDVYLTRQETADFLKINITTLWNWTNKGKIKSYGIGNRRYYNKQEIIALLKKNELR